MPFLDNVTAMAGAIMSSAMTAGSTAASTEPYSYLIAGTVAFGFIAFGLGFLLKRRGGRKGRK